MMAWRRDIEQQRAATFVMSIARRAMCERAVIERECNQ